MKVIIQGTSLTIILGLVHTLELYDMKEITLELILEKEILHLLETLQEITLGTSLETLKGITKDIIPETLLETLQEITLGTLLATLKVITKEVFLVFMKEITKECIQVYQKEHE